MARAWRRAAGGWLALLVLLGAPFAAPAQQGSFATDQRLLDLAGWQDAPLRPWRTRNAFTQRSLPGELEGPREFVETNLAHYRRDSDYACRRPALDRWFRERIGAPPLPPIACPGTLPFLIAATDVSSPLLQLDPARVYAIDYLLAEGNDAPMSRWGHGMLRLVVCAPGRAPGPACRLDLAEHLVLSFRAFVDDVQISSWRGLTGAYPSRLFVLPLAQVVSEYTEVDLRGLQSIPLRLSPTEIGTLLQRAAQVHWSYDGRYAFVGNNCAVETARLLQVGVPRLGAVPLMSITPTGLLRRLQRSGISDRSVLADRTEAIRLGFYFEPADTHQQAIYAVARDALGLPWDDAEDWLSQPSATRAVAIGQADLRTSAALLALEQLARRRIEQRAREAVKRQLLRPHRGAAGEVLALEASLTRPAGLLANGGYGLPQPDEIEPLVARSSELRARLLQEQVVLMAAARSWLPASLQAELTSVEANVAGLDARLRALGPGENGDVQR